VLAPVEEISSWQVCAESITISLAKVVLVWGQASVLATGADALKSQAPGPSRGTSTAPLASTTPRIAPVVAFAPATNAAEFALEAVAPT
jgi:hypothetical protein